MLAALLFAGLTGCTGEAKKAYHQHRADRFFAAGQFDRAEIEYLNVLRADVNNAHAYARLGEIYFQQGRLQSAAPFLYKASAFATNDLGLRLKLGYVYAGLANLQQARDAAEFILSRNPHDDDAPLLLADVSLTPKDVATTRKELHALAQSGDRAAYETALGSLAFRERDLESARAAFKRALALDPKFAAALEAMGALYAAQNDLANAETYFKAASDASDARSARRMMYARFELQTGHPDIARQILSEAVKQAPDYIPALMGLAEISLSEKKYDEAADLAGRVFNRDPDNFDALMFQSRLDLDQNNFDAAVSGLERTSKLYPKAPAVQCQLAVAYLALGDTTQAAICLNRALGLDPNFTDAILLLARLQLQNRNPDPVIVAMAQLIRKQPQLEEARLLLADAYNLRGRTSDALAIYQSLEKAFPQDPKLSLLTGSALVGLKDYAGAQTTFERLLQSPTTHLQALEQLVDLDLTERNFPAALQRVQNELQKTPDPAPFHVLAAKVYMAQGQTTNAETELAKAAELAPVNQSANLLLAQLYLNSGQNQKALARLDAVTAKDARNISAWMAIATIHEQAKEYSAAADAYEKILAVNPKFSPALNNLAYLYSEFLDRLDRAYDLAQQARALLPFDPSTADTLGWICLRRGSYSAALELLQESASEMPTVPEVQFHYGLACYMTGDEDDARAAFQQALQSPSAFRGQEESRLCLSLLDLDPRTANAADREKLEKRIAEKSNDPVAHGRLAAMDARDGNLAKATENYEAVLQTQPKNLPALIALARLYASKDPVKAMAMARNASQIAPDNAYVTQIMGRLAFQSGDFKFAASCLQQTARNLPDDALAQFDYARAAYNIGDVPTAQSSLQNALGLNLPAPQAAEAQQMLDLIALANNPTQAVAASQRVADVLKSHPDYVPALMAQAVIHWQNSHLTAAAADGEKILGLLPDFAPAQRLLAILYSNDPAQAAHAYDLAMKARHDFPDDPALAKATAIIVFQQGDFSRAARLLAACAAGPDADAETYYYLGSAQFQLHNHAASKSSLQRALTLKLSGQPAENAKKMLAELK